MLGFIPEEQTIINENDKIPFEEENKLIEFRPKAQIITAFHPKTKKENFIKLEKYNKFFYATIEELEDKSYLKVVYDKNKIKLYELED